MRPRSFVERIARELPPGRALDLACGSGRNAIWLAGRGWDVTAVDASIAFIEALRAAAPSVKTHVADLEKHEYTVDESAWDLIVVSYYLQRDLFEPIQRGLKPGGIAIIIVHVFEPGQENSRFSLHPGELLEHFRASTVLIYEEGKPEIHPQVRATARIAVQRR